MRIITKTPKWIRMTEALWQIKYKWSEQDLLDYLVKNGYTTEALIRKQISVENILNRIPNYRMTDWFPDLWEVSDVFIRHVNEDFRREEAELFYEEQWIELQQEEAELFYEEQWIELQQEESLRNDANKLQEPS